MIITKDILQRVFYCKIDNKSGSCLSVTKNGIAYLITARHLLPDKVEKFNSEIEILQSHKWVKIQATPYFPNDTKLDLVLLKTDILSKNEDARTLDIGGLCLGQDVAFLGFPTMSGLNIHPCVDINGEYPLPFVKRAIVSSMQFPYLYLDGHNNKGFSGGPVVFYDNNQRLFKICGIVTSYISCKNNIQINDKMVNNATSIENTGVFVAHSITPIKELLDII